MVLGEIFTESSISVVKTVWQKRGDKITRKEKSRRLAAAEIAPLPPAPEAKENANAN